MLYTVVKKQLHHLPKSEWEDDLDKAGDCLRLLDSYSPHDPVRMKFLEKLKGSYEYILAHIDSSELETSVEPAMAKEPSSSMSLETDFDSPIEYLFDLPKGSNEVWATSAVTLLEMLCWPFADMENMTEAKSDVRLRFSTDPKPYGVSQLVERLAWDFERNQPFPKPDKER